MAQFHTSAADNYENIVTKGEIAKDEQFPPFARMFSTLFNTTPFFLQIFHIFSPDIYRVVYYRLVVCGKGIKQELGIAMKQENLVKYLVKISIT